MATRLVGGRDAAGWRGEGAHMKRRQIVSASLVGLVAVGVAAVVLAVPGHHSAKATAPPSAAAYMPVPGSGEGEQFGAMDTYWNDRSDRSAGHSSTCPWRRTARPRRES